MGRFVTFLLVGLGALAVSGCTGEGGARDGGGEDASPDSSAGDAWSSADGGDAEADSDVPRFSADAGDGPDAPAGDAGPSSDAEADPDASPPVFVGTCADPPPVGAELPDAIPEYSSGECPTLVTGTNTLPSGGFDRGLVLVVPDDIGPDEELPVIFMWHWLGGSARSFREQGAVDHAVNAQRFIAAIPEERGDQTFRWPFLDPPLSSNARVEEELVFFDDMLACIAAQYPVDENCVSSIGVSAGGLWTPQVAMHRSRHLASFLSLSGGTGPAGFGFIPVRSWVEPEHTMPALVLWGGPTDFCIVDFATTSRNLLRGLTDAGHYVVECVHNCNHSQPPFDMPPEESVFAGMWDFALSHPYWLSVGVSPYQDAGLPELLPEWCGQGMGSATIRDGDCEGGILGECS